MGLLHFVIFNLLIVNVSLSYSQYHVSTLTGTGIPGYLDSELDSASFNGPFGIYRTLNGDLLIADGDNHVIRKISKSGIVSTYAGNGSAGYVDGPALSAQFNNPTNICGDDLGNVYISDFLNHRIRKISPQGLVSTLAGDGNPGFQDGPDTSSQFNYPRGIIIGTSGDLFVADSWNHRIRRVNPITGDVTTFAGGGVNIGPGSFGNLLDGVDSVARFYTPSGLAVDHEGNIYVADAFNHRIRIIDTFGMVNTWAGSGTTGQGNGGFNDGAALSARFNTPTDLYWSPNGKLFISDTYNNRLRLLQTFNVTTVAGTGNPGNINGPDSTAEFNWTRGITTNKSGDSIYVVDHNNHQIRLLALPFQTSMYDWEVRSLEIHPNPSNGNLIVSNQDKISHLVAKVYSLNGTLVHREWVKGEYIQLDLTYLVPSEYILVLGDKHSGRILIIQ